MAEEYTTEDVTNWIRAGLGNKRKARKLLRDFLARLVPGDVRWAINNHFDPWLSVVDKFHLGEEGVYPLAVFFLRPYYREIEGYLTRPRKILKLIASKNPKNAQVLDTPEGRRFLNEMCARGYNSLRLYLWPELGRWGA